MSRRIIYILAAIVVVIAAIVIYMQYRGTPVSPEVAPWSKCARRR